MEGNIGRQLVPISCLHVYIQLMHPYTCVYTCMNTQHKNVNYRKQNNKSKEKQGFCMEFLFGNYVLQKKTCIQIYPGLENECSYMILCYII